MDAKAEEEFGVEPMLAWKQLTDMTMDRMMEVITKLTLLVTKQQDQLSDLATQIAELQAMVTDLESRTTVPEVLR